MTSSLQNFDCNSNNTLAAPSDSNMTCKSFEDTGSVPIALDKMAEETIIQGLAKTNLDLVSLLSRIDKGTPTMIVEMLVKPIDESKSPRTHLDDILNSTREFLESLSLLEGSSRQYSVHSPRLSSFPYVNPNPISNTSRPSFQKIRNSYTSSLSGTGDSTASSPADSPPSSTPINLPSVDIQMCSKLDLSSVLLILTAYISLLRLYVVLFSHIHDFLKEISDSYDPSLCPLPGLSFCSFPLRKPFTSKQDSILFGSFKC